MTRLGPGDAGYRPELDSVLRRIRAEAVRADRMHLHDEVASATLYAQRFHGSSVEGRRRFGLEAAREILGEDARYTEGPWDTEVEAVLSAVDSLEVGLRLELDAEGPDPFPVRARVIDGGDSTSATAYLTPDEAQAAGEALIAAATRAREAAAAWQTTRQETQ